MVEGVLLYCWGKKKTNGVESIGHGGRGSGSGRGAENAVDYYCKARWGVARTSWVGMNVLRLQLLMTTCFCVE